MRAANPCCLLPRILNSRKEDTLAARSALRLDEPKEAPMSGFKIGHDAWVLVCDGRKALVLRNEGDAMRPDLKVEHDMHDAANPRTHEHGADRPGRLQTMGMGQRSSVEMPDYHDQQERMFVESVARTLSRLCDDRNIKSLVVVAALRALANVRNALTPEVRALVTAESDKDLTRHPVPEIERLLVAK